MALVCARCTEDRQSKFGTSRTQVELELTPVDGLQAVYLCQRCFAQAQQSATSGEIVRLQSQSNLVMQEQLGDGGHNLKLIRHRLNRAVGLS